MEYVGLKVKAILMYIVITKVAKHVALYVGLVYGCSCLQVTNEKCACYFYIFVSENFDKIIACKNNINER